MKFFILMLTLLFVLTGCRNSDQSVENNNYQTEKTSTENKNNRVENNIPYSQKEEELSTFTTTIYTKTEARQNNVKLACQELSETIVKPR